MRVRDPVNMDQRARRRREFEEMLEAAGYDSDTDMED